MCLGVLAALFIAAQVYSAPDQQTGQNLLTNPGFEGDFLIQCSFPGGRPWMTLPCGGALDTVPWQTVQVADGWHGWWQIPESDRKSPDYYQHPNFCGRSAPDDCVAWHNPEYRDTRSAPQDPPRIRSGENSQKYFSFWSVHEGGVYQTVSGVRPGSLLRFGIYMEVWSATKIDHGEPNPHFSFGQSSMHLRVGIDPTGGNDPWSTEIVWSSEQDAYDQFVRFEVEAVARASKVTVFTHSRPEYPMEHNDVYLDDAELTVTGGPGAPISINPPPDVLAVSALSATQSNVSGKVTHKVRAGDTLFAIALQYGVPVDQIMQLNSLSAESRLDIGRELTIVLPPVAAAPAPITTIGGTGSGQGSLCLKIYTDVDRDGVRSIADAALNLTGGQVVLLDANGDPIVDRPFDGSADQVCFDHLPATVYRLTAQLPAGYLAIGAQSWAVALDSDAAVDVTLGVQRDSSSSAAPIGWWLAGLGSLIVIALGIFIWRRRQGEMIGFN